MKTCARLWQVEAAQDGRLRGKDVESAQRHLETCAECARAARELAALSSAIAQLPPLTRDPVSVRRTRQQLLSAFNQALLEPKVSRGRRRSLPAIAIAASLLAALWLFASRKTAPPVAAPALASVVQVQASPDARWSEHLEKQLDRIDFSAGSASFTVRPHPGRRMLVSLPDGEIEDLGTIFAVVVQGQATRRVTVSEGRVSLRLRGRAEAIIGSGESWEAEAPPAEPALTTPAVVPATNSVPAPANPLRTAHAGSALNSAAPAAKPSSGAPVVSSKPDAGSEQAEDDAYLHIVALLRAGKQDDARAEAKRYLLLFPNGFRRVEVLNIVTR